jgi:hypothetical protein
VPTRGYGFEIREFVVARIAIDVMYVPSVGDDAMSGTPHSAMKQFVSSMPTGPVIAIALKVVAGSLEHDERAQPLAGRPAFLRAARLATNPRP